MAFLRKKWVRRPLLAFAATLLLLFLALLLLYFTFPSRMAGRLATKYGSLPSGYQVTVEEVRPFPLGTLEVRNLSAEDAGSGLKARFERLHVRYDVLPLLRGELSVREVLLEGPYVHLRLVATPTPTPTPTAPPLLDVANTPIDEWPRSVEKALEPTLRTLPPVDVEKITVRGLRVELEKPDQFDVILPDADLDASFHRTESKSDADFQLRVAPGPFSARAGRKGMESAAVAYRAQGEASLRWTGGGAFTAAYRGSVDDLTVTEPNRTTPVPPIRLQGELSGDLAKGDLKSDGPSLSMPGWVDLEGAADLRHFGLEKSSFRGHLRTTSKPTTDPFARFLSAFLSLNGWPHLDLEGNGTGRLLVKRLSEITSQLAALSLPAELSFSGHLEGEGLPSSLFPPGFSLRNVKGAAKISSTGKNAQTQMTATLSGLRIPPSATGGTKLPPLEVSAEGELRIEDLRNLSIDRAKLSIPTLGATASAQGKFQSRLPFPALFSPPTKTWPIRKFRESVQGGLNLVASLNPPKSLADLTEVKLSGRWQGEISLKKTSVERLDVDLRSVAHDLSAELPDSFQIRKLDLSVPVHRSIRLGRVGRGNDVPPSRVWTQPYAEDLRGLSPFLNSVRAESVTAAGFTLKDFSVDAGLDQASFIVHRVSAGFLDGSLWGNLSLLPAGETLSLTAALEAAELNARRLTRNKGGTPSPLSADARLALSIRPEEGLTAEQLVDEMDLRFHLTKIEPSTLDALIVYLDPKGENPSFVQARGLLKSDFVASALANPRISFYISHGILNADIALPNARFVDVEIPIRGISVKNLLRLAEVRKSVESMLPLIAMAKYLQAEGIDDDGKIYFASAATAVREVKR